MHGGQPMNKQIEEMAKIIARRSTAFRNPSVAFMTTAEKTAQSLYNAGYRKQSEVVRCKDCLSCNHCYPVKEKGKEAIEGFYCYTHKRYVKPDDFCSFAKMKGDKTDA